MARYPRSITKQINVAFPIQVYQRIMQQSRELGGIAPSALVRAEFLKATNSATKWHVGEEDGLPAARYSAPLELDDEDRVAIEAAAQVMVTKIKEQMAERVLADKRALAAAEEEKMSSTMGPEFDEMVEEWVESGGMDAEKGASRYVKANY